LNEILCSRRLPVRSFKASCENTRIVEEGCDTIWLERRYIRGKAGCFRLRNFVSTKPQVIELCRKLRTFLLISPCIPTKLPIWEFAPWLYNFGILPFAWH
jgi:hypothetical protein